MKKNTLSISLLGITMLLSSCEKYVDIRTQGSLVPKDIQNYRYLLNNTSTYETNTVLGNLASDDVSIVDASQQSSLISSDTYAPYRNSYTWQDNIFVLGTSYENDRDWNRMYSIIYNTNTIISELPASTGTPAQIAALTAEALVHRADAYLNLINQYALPYGANAATDLGVPLLTTQTVSQSLERASVEAVYQQILKDLKQAVPAIPVTQAYNTLPSKPAVYGLLARTYLYKNDYANAEAYADSALALRSTLNNLSTLTAASQHPKRINDPELLLSKTVNYGTEGYTPTALRMSTDLLALYDTTDQRYNLFTVPASKISSAYTGRYYYRDQAISEPRNVGPSVAEMILIKAEGRARAGQPAQAMALVNTLRRNRIKASGFVALTATSANDALIQVINERRREFCFRNLRWWDMRRLKSETIFQETITRTFNGITYTLTPDSKRYVFPIASYLIQLNPEIVPNP